MDLTRAHSRLLSLAASAMLTSAVLRTAPTSAPIAAAAAPSAPLLRALEGARADGWSGVEELPPPPAVAVPAAAAQSRPQLTPSQVQKLRKLATGRDGHVGHLRSAISSALGVGPADRDSLFPSYGVRDDESKVGYQIYLLPQESGYVIGRNENGGVRLFRLDADLKMLGAVSVRSFTDAPASIPAAEAARLCALDLTTWAQIADQLGSA